MGRVSRTHHVRDITYWYVFVTCGWWVQGGPRSAQLTRTHYTCEMTDSNACMTCVSCRQPPSPHLARTHYTCDTTYSYACVTYRRAPSLRLARIHYMCDFTDSYVRVFYVCVTQMASVAAARANTRRHGPPPPKSVAAVAPFVYFAE